jgi:hypothetical protein
MISSLAREWLSIAEMYSGLLVLVPPCVYVLIFLLTPLFSDILFDILTFPCFAAEIMKIFSARFDAKETKDAKGKGKVNPSSSLSHVGAEPVMGSNLDARAKAVPVARGSPLVRKTLAPFGTQKGGETRQNKRPRVT